MLDTHKIYLLSAIIDTMTALYIQSKILKIKINFKSFNFYIGIIASTFLIIINRSTDGYVRFIFNCVIMLCCSRIVFSKKIFKLYGAVFLQQLIMFISELICLIILALFNKSLLTVSYSDFWGILAVNTSVSVLAILIYKIKWVSKLCDKIESLINDVVGLKKYLLPLFFIATSNILLMFMYFKDDIIIIINSIFIVIYGFIVYSMMAEANEKLKIKQQNEGLIKTLNEYEKMLDYQRVNNHENKNQLLVLKSIASKNNKKLHTYLDEIIKEKRDDDEILYASTKRIPQGGLQGLIYQKMLFMKDKNINTILNIDRKIKKNDLSSLNSKTNFDLCRAIGIIIDNAIEETQQLKEKEIFIDMYEEDTYLVIEIANKCKTIPDLDKIDEGGYTTRELGHGYGLTLLKEICNKNNYIINERKIVGNVFSQIIKIKM